MPEVRVIADDGEQLGIMETRAAIRLARERGLDLVEVAATADPPVCRIIDFGKFQYETKKKANEAKKKQVIITVKEVKFRPGTDDHDYNFKMKHARDWLSEGDKVKATIFFRGREITHRELGTHLLQKLEKDLETVGEVETRPRMEGNQMFFIFTPKKHKSSGGGAAKSDSGNRPSMSGGPTAAKPESGTRPPVVAAAVSPTVVEPEAVEPESNDSISHGGGVQGGESPAPTAPPATSPEGEVNS